MFSVVNAIQILAFSLIWLGARRLSGTGTSGWLALVPPSIWLAAFFVPGLIALQPLRLASGEYLFRQGDPGDRLYVITSGAINVFSASAPGSTALPQRYVSLSPGMMLGETAMLDGGGRSGDAVADGATDVHSLDDRSLQRLRDEDPLLYAQVHRNIALHLSQRLRAAAWAWRSSTS